MPVSGQEWGTFCGASILTLDCGDGCKLYKCMKSLTSTLKTGKIYVCKVCLNKATKLFLS